MSSIAKKERPDIGRCKSKTLTLFPEETIYFAGGVVEVVLLLFLLFLPPLWALLLLPFFAVVAFAGSLPVVLLSLPAGACANARLPASNIVKTTVKNFFMQISF
jgi:hypothetical protein